MPTSSPAWCNRANRRQSRLSVLTRSLGGGDQGGRDHLTAHSHAGNRVTAALDCQLVAHHLLGRRNREAALAPCRAIDTIYGAWRSTGRSDTGLPIAPLWLEDAARTCLLAGEAHPSLSVRQGGSPWNARRRPLAMACVGATWLKAAKGGCPSGLGWSGSPLSLSVYALGE